MIPHCSGMCSATLLRQLRRSVAEQRGSYKALLRYAFGVPLRLGALARVGGIGEVAFDPFASEETAQ